ncbi:MAG TPA: hypothetical protein VGL71_09355, partial [Urbifossiella sp.]
ETISADANPTERPPETAAEFFERGQSLLDQDLPDAARADFLTAHAKSQDPWALAYASYAYALSRQFPIAIEMAEQAMAQGAQSPELENNLGYLHGQVSNYPAALAHLDAAVRDLPDPHVALFNRAMVRYQMKLKRKPDANDGQAIKDLEAALAGGPSFAERHFVSAQIFLAYSDQNLKLRESALGQIGLSLRMGKDPAKVKSNPILKAAFGKDERFKKMVNAAPVADAAEPDRQDRLLEPRRP